MAFKNYIFDIDGTLIDSYYAGTKSIHDALLQVTNVDYPNEVIHKSYAMVQVEFLKTLGIDPNSQEGQIIIQVADEIYNANLDKVKVFQDMEDVLDNLKSSGKFLGIVTSRVTREFAEPLPNIFNKFNTIVTADTVSKPKPDPESLDKIIKEYNLLKEETIYIGDSFQDSECAKRANIKFAFADFISNEDVPHDYYLSEPKDILNI